MTGLDSVADELLRGTAELRRAEQTAEGWRDAQRTSLERGHLLPLHDDLRRASQAARTAATAIATAYRDIVR